MNMKAVGFALERIMHEQRARAGKAIIVTPKTIAEIIEKRFFAARERKKLNQKASARTQLEQNIQDVLHTTYIWTNPLDTKVKRDKDGFVEVPQSHDRNARYLLVNEGSVLKAKAHRFHSFVSSLFYYFDPKKSWGLSKQIAFRLGAKKLKKE